jgi:hypothetical protein
VTLLASCTPQLIMKNDCQYVCIWKDEDSLDSMPLEKILETCEQKKDPAAEYVPQPPRRAPGEALRLMGVLWVWRGRFYKAFQDFAQFFDDMIGKTAEMVRRLP